MPDPVHFEHADPILRVEDMPRALAFYCGRLGFTNAGWGCDDFTCITRDGANIYLCRGDQGRGQAWVWIGVSDARRLHDELAVAGLPIRMAPTNYPWALEFHLEDLDGNVLRLGSEPE